MNASSVPSRVRPQPTQRFRVVVESHDGAEAASRAMQWADGALRVLQLTERPRQELHLALDEVLTNIGLHAYAEGELVRIWLTMSRYPGEVRVVVADAGVAFNPLRHVRGPEDVALSERRIGGLGIFLTTRVADELKYRRRDRRNTLTLVKRT